MQEYGSQDAGKNNVSKIISGLIIDANHKFIHPSVFLSLNFIAHHSRAWPDTGDLIEINPNASLWVGTGVSQLRGGGWEVVWIELTPLAPPAAAPMA